MCLFRLLLDCIPLFSNLIGALVILIYNIVTDLVSLIFQEVLSLYQLGQDIINSDNLGSS